MRKIFLILLVLSLVACSAAKPKRDTYDLIGSELEKSIESKAKPAQQDAVSAALLPPLTIEMPKAHQQQDERFNLSFSNAPAQQFFMSIASGTRYNMLVHPEVTGTISATLKNVTLLEAMDSIRELYGYDYKVEGSRIYVFPLTMQTKVFQVNYLNSSRRGMSDIRVTSGSVADSTTSSTPGSSTSSAGTGSAGTSGTTTRSLDSSKISTSSDSNFWGELKTSLDAIVGNKDGRSVVISPLSGVVVVRAMPAELRSVASFLKAMQLSVDRQVILEAKIVEVELNDGFQAGVNWAAFRTGNNSKGSFGMIMPGSTLATSGSISSVGQVGRNANNAGDINITATPGESVSSLSSAIGTMFGIAFQSSNFAALISFLESQGTVHVLSSPRITTMNNQKAVLKVGTDEFFVTKITTTPGTIGTTTTSATTSVEVQPFFSGVSLDVTPQIDENDNVVLHVHPSVSQVTTVNKEIRLGRDLGSMNLPLASSTVSETDSMVRGKNGSIFAIGGLMRHSAISDRSQLPVAGDVPILGNLFGSTNRVAQKRELVILIKPTVVNGDAAWTQDLIESRDRIRSLAPPAPKPGMLQ